MTTPSPSTPPRKRLIIPGAPDEEVHEPEAANPVEEPVEEPVEDAREVPELVEQAVDNAQAPVDNAEEQTEHVEGMQAEVVEEVPQETAASEEHEEQAVEGAVDEVQAEASVESDDGEFLMVDGQEPDEQLVEQEVPANAPTEIAASEPKTVRRLLPRGAVHDETAPVPRRFSSFQTSSVPVAADQVQAAGFGDYQEDAQQETVEHSQPATHAAAGAAVSPGGQQHRPAYVPPKSGVPSWIFSMIGFLFGVVAVLSFVKLGLMPPALGLTDRQSLREAVEEERARIIKILEKDGFEGEDWDNFEEEND